MSPTVHFQVTILKVTHCQQWFRVDAHNEQIHIVMCPPGEHVFFGRITWRTVAHLLEQNELFQSFDDDATSAAPNHITAPRDAQSSSLDEWLKSFGNGAGVLIDRAHFAIPVGR